MWLSCLYHKKGLSAPWRFEAKPATRRERKKKSGRRERCRLRHTSHVSPAPPPITNSHIDSLRRRGVANTARDTAAAANGCQVYTLIYTKQCCKFTRSTCWRNTSGQRQRRGLQSKHGPHRAAERGEADGGLPVGQRICCIFCRWCGRCCPSRWHWWDTPAKTKKAKLKLQLGLIF